MPAYNFKGRFAPKVESGAKPHTIRALRRDGRNPKAGQPFIAYQGMRTKHCRLLLRGVITKVQSIAILRHGSVRLDDQRLAGAALVALLTDDGFDSYDEFIAFFKDTYGLPFHGELIHFKPESADPDQARRILGRKLK